MEVIDDITQFLPKYPNINPEKEEVFNIYDDNFYGNIYRKKEFYDNKLNKIEKLPDFGGLLKHQQIIARFFTSYTPYDQLLLLHEMGTGKSCSAIGAIEQTKADGGFRGALYLARGDALINNFINELIFKCTDGRYIPENYDKLTKLEQIHRKKKAVSDYYNFNTFETFAKYIKNSSDTKLQNEYNNMIIVIDEVHNLRIQGENQDKKEKLKVYEQFYRFLHTVKNCKILLMSGTPMKDGVEEIASVMNLILPKKENKPYLPTENEFINKYFNETNNIFTVKPEKIPELKNIFKGRVSYLKAMQSDVKIVFKGEKIGENLKYFNVVENVMSDFQTAAYTNAWDEDTGKGNKKGVYSNSRQASLFVFPDSSYGATGFKKYIKYSTRKTTNFDVLTSFSLKIELLQYLKKETPEETLEQIRKCSSIYAATIENILEAQQNGKCVFIYNEFVYGSGLILFGLLLELFGFKKATGKEEFNNFQPRYASLTNVTSTTTQIREIVSRFNSVDNVNGKVINIIMGSKKIAEGFSFQNIQIEEIQTPWYNYSETSQAIARGIRLGSHNMLIKSGITNPVVDIYQRVSIPNNGTPSIDLEMYEISESKDISIKNVERIIKESAFDCALTYNRNKIDGKDGKRECDYIECLYYCDDISPELLNKKLNNNVLDLSTYQLYYNNKNILDISNNIKQIFRYNFSLDLATIKNELSDSYSDFDIISSLRHMINRNEIIKNKYGFNSYLREENNIYFLITNLSLVGKSLSDYYTKYPHVIVSSTFDDIFIPIYYQKIPEIIDEICNLDDKNNLQFLLNKLPDKIIEYLIEQTIYSEQRNIQKNQKIRKILLDHFNKFINKIDNVWISSYLYNKNQLLRCSSNNGKNWENCEQNILDKFKNLRSDDLNRFKNNPYGYYGLYNTNINPPVFCIRDVSEEIKEGHKITTGKNCSNWTKQSLYSLVIDKLKIKIPNDEEFNNLLILLGPKNNNNKTGKNIISGSLVKKYFNSEEPKKTLINIIMTEHARFKDIQKNYTKSKLNGLSEDNLKRIIYWGTMDRNTICPKIQQWFKDNNLLDENDTGCGLKKDRTKDNR